MLIKLMLIKKSVLCPVELGQTDNTFFIGRPSSTGWSINAYKKKRVYAEKKECKNLIDQI